MRLLTVDNPGFFVLLGFEELTQVKRYKMQIRIFSGRVRVLLKIVVLVFESLDFPVLRDGWNG